MSVNFTIEAWLDRHDRIKNASHKTILNCLGKTNGSSINTLIIFRVANDVFQEYSELIDDGTWYIWEAGLADALYISGTGDGRYHCSMYLIDGTDIVLLNPDGSESQMIELLAGQPNLYPARELSEFDTIAHAIHYFIRTGRNDPSLLWR